MKVNKFIGPALSKAGVEITVGEVDPYPSHNYGFTGFTARIEVVLICDTKPEHYVELTRRYRELLAAVRDLVRR